MCMMKIFLGKSCNCVWLGGIAQISKRGVLVGHQIHTDNLFPKIPVVGVLFEAETLVNTTWGNLYLLLCGLLQEKLSICYIVHRNLFSHLLLWCIIVYSCADLRVFMRFYNCIIFNFFVNSGSGNFNHSQTEKPSFSLFCSKCCWSPGCL